MIVYLAYGAIVGDQYIPYKRGEGGLHLRGLAAWIVTLGPVLLYMGVLVRHGLFVALGPRFRIAIEFALILAGIAAFGGGIRLGVQ